MAPRSTACVAKGVVAKWNPMSKYLDRARNYHNRIRDILLKEWDPIGVGDVPEAQDEYDSYVGELYGMLTRHAPRHALIDHLWEIETVSMELSGNKRHTEKIADRLLKL